MRCSLEMFSQMTDAVFSPLPSREVQDSQVLNLFSVLQRAYTSDRRPCCLELVMSIESMEAPRSGRDSQETSRFNNEKIRSGCQLET